MAIRVILADDHAVMRDGLRLILEAAQDITVVADAADGCEAVSLTEKHEPDVAVLDIAMPTLNGLEAAHRIRDAAPDTRVIILSMHATTQYIFRALEVGAMGYVLKESAGREVVHAVRQVMAGRRYLSHGIAETVLDDYVRQRAGSSGDDTA